MAFLKSNQTIPFRLATAFSKSSVSCAGRLSRNNTKRFKWSTDWVYRPFYRKLGTSPGTCLPVHINGRLAIETFSSPRSIPPEVYLGQGVLKICSKFTGEHPCQSVTSFALRIVFYQDRILATISKSFSGGCSQFLHMCVSYNKRHWRLINIKKLIWLKTTPFVVVGISKPCSQQAFSHYSIPLFYSVNLL